MSVIRPYQPGITRVLPHAQNRKYAIPNNRPLGRFTTPVVFLGDSILSGNGGYQAGNWETPADYVPSLPRLSQYNEARGGATLDVIDTNFATDVDAHPDATSIIMDGGLNDIEVGDTLAQMQASVISIFGKAAARDLPIMYCLCPPYEDSPTWTAAKGQLVRDFNSWIQGYCNETGNTYVDTFTKSRDPARPNGDYRRPEYEPAPGTGQYVHLNQYGSEQWGRWIRDAQFEYSQMQASGVL